MNKTNTYAEHGYCVLKSLLSVSATCLLLERTLVLSRLPQFQVGDRQVPGTPAVAADPVMEGLLEQLRPTIEKTASVRLYPTYSYFRVYKRGDRLIKHRDRPACEVSLSLALGYDPDEPWPLWVESRFGPVSIPLERGDALLYRGTEIPHWRDEFTGNYVAQVFLHYVDQSGPYKEWKFDKRVALGGNYAFDTEPL
jgi:hypothetical protein